MVFPGFYLVLQWFLPWFSMGFPEFLRFFDGFVVYFSSVFVSFVLGGW